MVEINPPFSRSGLSAHSTRGASSSTAAMSGVTMKNILDTADWAAARTFQRFYLRVEDRMIEQEVQPHLDYATAILAASNSCCDMEPEPSEVQSQNGQGHDMPASYSGL